MWRDLPYQDLILCTPGWDINDPGYSLDETEEDVEDGMSIRMATNINVPPKLLSCSHQLSGDLYCMCPDAIQPNGYNVRIWWDKGSSNKRNRYLHIPMGLYKVLCLFLRVRRKYFLGYMMNGPDGNIYNGEDNWFEGTTKVFLNLAGRSDSRFVTNMLNLVSSSSVTPKDFRRFYVTWLAHHRNTQLQKSAPAVVGHSEQVRDQWYDDHARQTGQGLMQAIVSVWKSQLLGDDVTLGEDESTAYKREIERLKKIQMTLSKNKKYHDVDHHRQPVKPEIRRRFIEGVEKIMPGLIRQHNSNKKEKNRLQPSQWKFKVFKALSMKSPAGDDLRSVFKDFYYGNSDLKMQRWSGRRSHVRKLENLKDKMDCSSSWKDPLWFCLVIFHSSIDSLWRGRRVNDKKK